MGKRSDHLKNEHIYVLKYHEQRCYQIAYYLLNCEKKAVDAAQRALFQLANDRSFLTAPSDVQDMKAREVTIMQSFAVHLQRS